MPAAPGANAKNILSIARGSLLAMILAAPMALWWPSTEGWTALVVATGLLWLCWLCRRTVAGQTDIPGNRFHLALAGIGVIACVHLVLGGSQSTGGRSLHGQFDASLVTHICLLALLVVLVQDLWGRVRLRSPGPTLFGSFVLGGGLMGLVFSTRPEGKLMLAMMAWTGLAMLCLPLWRHYVAPAGARTPIRWRNRRFWRLTPILMAAIALAILCPAGVPIVTAAVALTLAGGAAFLPGQRKNFALAGLIAAISAATHLASIGWIQHPAYPVSMADWFGRGGQALLDVGPWACNFSLLIGAVGWAGALWLVICLGACLLAALLTARTAAPGAQARILLSVLVAQLATITWLSPGGMFTPGVNVVFAVVWAMWPSAVGKPVRRRSGWWMLAVLVLLTLALALVRRMGLLVWVVRMYDRGDGTLHLFTGWIVTQMLLWLLSRRRFGAVIAMAVTLSAAGLGELAQWKLSSRSAQTSDVLNHAKGAACALVVYLICKACLWCESTDIVVRPEHVDPDNPDDDEFDG